jgi:hypothetical protein
MIAKISEASRRVRRAIAQRGLRNALANIIRRLRSGNLSLSPARPTVVDESHPFDQSTGLDTGGFIHGSQLATGHPHDVYSTLYYGTAPSMFRSALANWQPRQPYTIESYTFIDFGSGKGRCVMLAAEHPFCQCIGVELNRSLHEIAAQNMERWRHSGSVVSPMRSKCLSATDFEFPETPCLAYFFNPFTARVISEVLDHMEAAFAGRPGDLDILYVNDEFYPLIEQRPGFQRVWQMPIAMSMEDSDADILHTVETFRERPNEPRSYPCSAWRWIGNRPS